MNEQPKSFAAVIYGIKTCDTMRKARAWLEGRGIAAQFHDYRVSGLERATLEAWVEQVGWQTLLNKSSTSFRALPEPHKQNIDRNKALALMLIEPTMIKRPVLNAKDTVIVGFNPEIYSTLFE